MTRLHDNIILKTDSYKLSHAYQYPPGTEYVYSYLESRPGARFPYSVFHGIQAIILKHLSGKVVTKEKLSLAENIATTHMGGVPKTFYKEGWEYIIDKYDGMLPIEIRAVREGTKVPTSNVLMTIVNTDPKCFWLTNYIETILMQVWYPTTVATLSNYCRDIILKYLSLSGTEGLIDFKLHDFGFRGASCLEAAGIGGLAHLINFKGSDTLAALGEGMEYYESGVCGFSIPASEHSTMTSWGKSSEADAYANMLKQYPTGLVACVSDSYDIENACKNIWGYILKNQVLSRDGILVIRPDSGELVPTVMKVLTILGEQFGTSVNSKGYKVLNDKVRVIQGDGCSVDTIPAILEAMTVDKWSADNIAFGMGGGLLQKIDRDTQKFAIKCSSVTIHGEQQDVFKNPVGDSSKKSKRGRLALIKNSLGSYETITTNKCIAEDQLKLIFRNGEMLFIDDLESIRKRAIG